MQKKPSILAALALTGSLLTSTLGAQENPVLKHFPQQLRGKILVPLSNLEFPEDIGRRYHTMLYQFAVPQASYPQGETPASIRAVYNLPSTGGSNAIAIIGAFDYAAALSDFNNFSNQFGLPKETSGNVLSSSNKVLQIVYATGNKPSNNSSQVSGWNLEAALDIQWAHAMAPNAKIYLVEGATNSTTDLGKAIQVANKLAGVKEISMSFSSSEYSGETSDDRVFSAPGIVYLASSGDDGGRTVYPSSSPKVVAVGGTRINRTLFGGTFTGETGWSGSGGGVSVYESRPSYQSAVSGLVGSKRGVPDLSLVADPYSGASVYCAAQGGWLIVGGTSLSSPAMAGILNLCATLNGNFANNTNDELTRIYSNLGTPNFRDITSGFAGGYSCTGGWDFVTGSGSTITTVGK